MIEIINKVPPGMPLDPWLSPQGVADEVGRHYSTVWQDIHRGLCPYWRLGPTGKIRVPVAALEVYRQALAGNRARGRLPRGKPRQHIVAGITVKVNGIYADIIKADKTGFVAVYADDLAQEAG